MRAAVRSPAKRQNLLDLYSSYGSKLRLCMVDDIAQDGAFDDVVKAVEGIIHTASPVHLSADDPNEMIIPAVNGVTGLLKSALKHGTSLQRMNLTSSSAAIRHYSALPITLSEADWNDECEARVSSLGRAAERTQSSMYLRSSNRGANFRCWAKPSTSYELEKLVRRGCERRFHGSKSVGSTRSCVG